MTHRQAFTATVGHAEQEARGRRCCPAGRVLRAILGRAVPALVAAAILAATAPDLAAQVEVEEPKVTIAAERSSHGFGIDDVVFDLTRSGPKDVAISVQVSLTQADLYLAEGELSRVVEFAADATAAELRIGASLFDGPATESGVLRATLVDASGYRVGRPNSAQTRMLVKDPAITVRPERASYSIDEDDGEVRVTFIARTASDLPRPGKAFSIAVSSKAGDDDAVARAETGALSQTIDFRPRDFAADDGEWEARKTVSISMVEGARGLDVKYQRAASTPERIRPRNSDGSACTDDVCMVPVIMPPEATADHGPFYRKDDFLAVPEGAVHGRGATLTFTLNLDTEVTVTGAPELVLDIYDRERRARYTGGSGTRQLTFTWTVAKGDNDPDGLEFRFLDLNGGTIRDGEDRDLLQDTLPAQRFAEHRVRGGLFAMRLEVSGSAREGEPFEIRVIRNGGYDEPAVAVVGVTDSALPHIPQLFTPALNGPGVRQFDFHDGEPSEPGVRTSTRTVTPPGDGTADESRTLTLQLTITDAGIDRHTGQSIRAWYLAEEPLEVTVPVIDTGQPLAEAGLRVHETSTTEAPGAKLVFRVSLSPRSDSPVTVEYRTGDDPANESNATAGEDYEATEGTLTFEPGETLKTVEVDVLADDHDEDHETMRLILSNAQGARIDRASARGVIKNEGPIPRAWLGRFGRTVAEQVLDAVESRMRSVHKPGVEVTLAGQRFGGQAPQEASRAQRDSAWQERAGFGSPASRSVTQDELLSGTSFAVTAETGQYERATLWGRGAVTRFEGREGNLMLDGEVASAMVGADWAREDWTAGLIVSRSVGEGRYAGHSEGRVEATLTGFYPWGRLALSEQVEAWGAAGYGTGALSVTPKKPGTNEDAATIRGDLDLRMAAAGLRGSLLDGAEDGLALVAKTDALIVQTASDAARGPDGGNLAAARASVTRLRLGLEGSQSISLGDGATLTPSAEVGVRHDGGDAETGFGVDFGGGIAWSDPESGLSAELRGHALLTHEADDFRERGVSASLAWDPKPTSALGPTATLTQTVGDPASGSADALLAQGALTGLAAQPGSELDGEGDLQHRRLEARFGYGFPAWDGRFASVPEVGLGLSDTGRE